MRPQKDIFTPITKNNMETNKIYHGDSLETLKTFPSELIDCIVTSPPYYGLRDYGKENQIGLEETPEEYIKKMVVIFREAKRVLKSDGTLWLNLGDSYWANRGKNGLSSDNYNSKNGDQSLRAGGKRHPIYKPKDLMGIPWRVALALQEDGWYLRSDIIWHKPNVIPESVSDRPTKSHEYIFLLSKSRYYYYDGESIKEDSVYKEQDPVMGSSGAFGPNQSRVRKSKAKGSFDGKLGKETFRSIRNKRNKRDVWTITTKPFRGAHFATFPVDLIEPCVVAGCPEDGIVMDPFMGSGTTAITAIQNRRKYIGIELNQEYIQLANSRVDSVQINLL